MNSKLPLLNETNKTKLCAKCSEELENKLKINCMNCNNLFCMQCYLAHKDLLNPEEPLPELSNYPCPTHPEEMLEFDCECCSLPICKICEENEHTDHHVVSLQDAYKLIREIVKAEFPYHVHRNAFPDLEKNNTQLIEEVKNLSKLPENAMNPHYEQRALEIEKQLLEFMKQRKDFLDKEYQEIVAQSSENYMKLYLDNDDSLPLPKSKLKEEIFIFIRMEINI